MRARPYEGDYRKRELWEEWTQAAFRKGQALRFIRFVNLRAARFHAREAFSPAANRAPATSGRFCRPQNYECVHGIFLTRGFVATYLANAKMTRENRPEVRFQGENRRQNLRNRPDVDQWRQLRPGHSRTTRVNGLPAGVNRPGVRAGAEPNQAGAAS